MAEVQPTELATKPEPRKLTIAERFGDIIRARYPYESAKALAAELGCNWKSLSEAARTMGVKSINWRQRAGETNANRDRGVRVDYFDQWSDEMAYVLGYIWADGCIFNKRGKPSGLSLLCTRGDERLIISIAQLITKQVKINRCRSYKNKKGYTTKEFSQIRINGIPLASRLINLHGVLPRKSELDLPFPEVPKQYLCHFIRGHFDGDGSVWRAKGSKGLIVEFLSTHRFIEKMRDMIVEATGVSTHGLTKRNDYNQLVSHVRWQHRKEIAAIYRWLYPSDKLLCLERKRLLLAESVQPKSWQKTDYSPGEPRGVTQRSNGKWDAYPSRNHLRYHLGSYAKKEEAMLAVNIAYQFWYGEAAILNDLSAYQATASRQNEIRTIVLAKITDCLS